MNRSVKNILLLFLVSVFLFISASPGFAAAVRRVPDYDTVEQGLMALTLDVEGADDFRYTGQDNKMHVYRGTVKPGSKLKFVMRTELINQKSLPITGRTCSTRFQVTAKKGSEVVKKQNFKSANKSNVFANFTVPQNADTVEVIETFALNNKSTNKKFNLTTTSKNRVILTAAGVAVAAGKTTGSDKTEMKGNTKDAGGKTVAGSDADNKSGTGSSKTIASGDTGESKGTSAGMLAGAAAAVAAVGGGAFFFMKKRKENQAANEEIALKEKLREQAIWRQQELQQQNLQRRQEEINQHNRMLEEQRRREQEQQRLMQEQNAMQQSGTAGAYVTGATGVVGGVQQNAAVNVPKEMADDVPHFCQNCGTPLKPGDKFCENCGAKV